MRGACALGPQDNFIPLCIAALNGHADVVQLLITAKATLDIKQAVSNPCRLAPSLSSDSRPEPVRSPPQDGTTPLIIASMQGHAAVASRLIAARADVNTRDNVGPSAP